MNAIVTSALELIKYKLLYVINTGDKTFDLLIMGVVTLVLTMITGWILKILENVHVIKKYCRCPIFRRLPNGPLKKVIDREIYICNDSLSYRVGFAAEKMYETITQWVVDNDIPLKEYGARGNVYVFKSLDAPPVAKSKNIYKTFRKLPVYAYDNHVVFLHYDDELFMSTSSSEKAIEKFIESVKNHNTKHISSKLTIYNIVPNTGSLNEMGKLPSSKTFDNIIGAHKELLIDYLDRFNAGNLYEVDSAWIPNNLGILLHGAPGLGKTSLIKSICNYTKRNPILVDIRLISTRSVLESIFEKYATKDYVIVLEEFDFMSGVLSRSESAIKNEIDIQLDTKIRLEAILACSDADVKSKLLEEFKLESTTKKKSPDLSLLLQLMDGVLESSDRLIIATTNCPDMIDPALLRPGRFDLVLKLNPFTRSQVIELLNKLIKLTQQDNELISNSKIIENVWSPVEIVNITLTYKKDVAKILEILSSVPVNKLKVYL